MGIGIWAMHYIGMEAFRLPIPVMYDWPTVLLSLFAAILASGVALFTVSRPTVTRRSMIVGGILMGGGIAAMHYIGMEAMRIPAMCMYTPWLVVVSIVLAIAISFVALQQAFLFREETHLGRLAKDSQCSAVGFGNSYHALRRHGGGVLHPKIVHHRPRLCECYQCRPRLHCACSISDPRACLHLFVGKPAISRTVAAGRRAPTSTSGDVRHDDGGHCRCGLRTRHHRA